MKKRVYQVATSEGPFVFFCDTLTLAVDHARQLSNDPAVPHIDPEEIGRVKFVGWREMGSL